MHRAHTAATRTLLSCASREWRVWEVDGVQCWFAISRPSRSYPWISEVVTVRHEAAAMRYAPGLDPQTFWSRGVCCGH